MYLDISWKGMPPSEKEILAMWDGLVFSILPTQQNEHPLIKAFSKVYASRENVVFFQIMATEDPVFSWYASRNRLPEIGFFGKLLRSPAVISKLNLELDCSSIKEPVFEFTSGFCLDGLLATDLFWGGGGCGGKFIGSASTAKNMGESFFQTLAGNRFEEVTVYHTRQPWSSWFQECGADVSYIVLDRRTGIFSLLLLTDSA